MISPESPSLKPRVCAVSYLNTAPLVWGLLHDPAQRDLFDLRFALPSECAAQLASGEADIGIVPVIEMARQGLGYFPETGIACHGPVRSILLVSKVPFREIRTLAADAGSRTSVMLARVILGERFGATPRILPHPPVLAPMLEQADAALLIGDAALHLDPSALPFETLDLGGEWVAMTGLPMVFAVWSGRRELLHRRYAGAFQASCRYGLERIDEIVREEAPKRGFPDSLAHSYLTSNIVFELGARDLAGMDLFLKSCALLDRTPVSTGVSLGAPAPVSGGVAS